MFSSISSWYRTRQWEQAVLDWDEADAGASRARVVGLLAAEPGLVLHVLPGRGGMTALGVAIDGGAKQLVELLVETSPSGPPQQGPPRTPLADRLAAATGSQIPPHITSTPSIPSANPLLKQQLQHRDTLERTPLVVAIERNEAEIVSLLLQKGGLAQLEGRHETWTPLMCGYGNVEAVRVILDAVDDGAIVTPKWPIPNAAPTDGPPDSHAITIGTPTSPNASVTVAALLAARNQAGHSLFHLACLHASLNVVHYLLNERLAELTASQDLFSLIQEKDGSGRNVLHLACAGPPNGSNGSPASRADCVRALINTVLASLPDERERVLRTLLTERTPESWNVMMLASLSGHAAVLSLLIEYTDAYPALQGELLNAADAQGVSLAGLALSARASKPWLRTELDQVLGLISSLESPAVSPGTPVKPPLLVAQAPRAGRPGAVEVQVQLQSGVDDGHESSPGSAVSGEERSGLSRKKHAEDRD